MRLRAEPINYVFRIESPQVNMECIFPLSNALCYITRIFCNFCSFWCGSCSSKKMGNVVLPYILPMINTSQLTAELRAEKPVELSCKLSLTVV